VPSIRRRRQFEAEILTPQGTALSGCFVLADIETSVQGASRSVTWRGKFTSLTNPERAFAGPYLLRPRGASLGAPVEVTSGIKERKGLTSDEYEFRGSSPLAPLFLQEWTVISGRPSP
jgi:hypothetical protein